MNTLLNVVGAALAAISITFGSAVAADMPEAIDATKPNFDIAFGVRGMSEYMVRGVAQTSRDPAIQGYAEAQAFDWVYAGVLATSVNFGGASDPSAEFDLYGGLRHSFGALTLDAGYVWVAFSGSAKGVKDLEYGKVYGVASYAVTDQFTVGANIFYGSNFINFGPEVVHSTAFAKYTFTPLINRPDIGAYVSGSFSKQWTTQNFVKDYLYWDAGAGVSYKAVTLDLRYSDTNLSKRDCLGYIGNRDWCGSRLLATLSFDTSLNKLK
ncbi:TorF family putative porin [Methylopila musalis]|uniref:TorF family putative porin n=1 Tax=Methylopila musalis TaxID=1134781 RepID=A0ABW3Z5V1_9HYPH